MYLIGKRINTLITGLCVSLPSTFVVISALLGSILVAAIAVGWSKLVSLALFSLPTNSTHSGMGTAPPVSSASVMTPSVASAPVSALLGRWRADCLKRWFGCSGSYYWWWRWACRRLGVASLLGCLHGVVLALSGACAASSDLFPAAFGWLEQVSWYARWQLVLFLASTPFSADSRKA